MVELSDFGQLCDGLPNVRCIAGMDLPINDDLTEEHRLVDDGFLGDLWKAYKKCIKNNRTGPAQQLLRDIEERINEA